MWAAHTRGLEFRILRKLFGRGELCVGAWLLRLVFFVNPQAAGVTQLWKSWQQCGRCHAAGFVLPRRYRDRLPATERQATGRAVAAAEAEADASLRLVQGGGEALECIRRNRWSNEGMGSGWQRSRLVAGTDAKNGVWSLWNPVFETEADISGSGEALQGMAGEEASRSGNVTQPQKR